MNELQNILLRIAEFLGDEAAKENDLSLWLEFFICENYETISAISADIARFLNDDIVDICEQTEPGLEGTQFRKQIADAYYKLLEMVKRVNDANAHQ